MDILFSNIYCQGDLLDEVQLTKVFSNPKTFVDFQMNRNESFILEDFENLKSKFNDTIPFKILRRFVIDNFKFDRLDEWLPPDFKEYQPIFEYLKDDVYKLVFKNCNQNVFKRGTHMYKLFQCKMYFLFFFYY